MVVVKTAPLSVPTLYLELELVGSPPDSGGGHFCNVDKDFSGVSSILTALKVYFFSVLACYFDDHSRNISRSFLIV